MTYEKRGLYIDEAHLEAFAENYARSLRPGGAVSGKPAAAELRRKLRTAGADQRTGAAADGGEANCGGERLDEFSAFHCLTESAAKDEPS